MQKDIKNTYWLGWETELKLFLADAAKQIIGHKHEGKIYKFFNVDTRQQHIARERAKMTKSLKLKVAVRDNWTCQVKGCGVRNYMNQEPGMKMHVDHKKSLWDWGLSILYNLELKCEYHNLSKGRNSDPVEEVTDGWFIRALRFVVRG